MLTNNLNNSNFRQKDDGRSSAYQNNNTNEGFALMDRSKQQEIASEDDTAVHEKGSAHEFDSEEAVEGERKRGQNHSNRNNNSRGDDQSNNHGSSKGSGSRNNRNK